MLMIQVCGRSQCCTAELRVFKTSVLYIFYVLQDARKNHSLHLPEYNAMPVKSMSLRLQDEQFLVDLRPVPKKLSRLGELLNWRKLGAGILQAGVCLPCKSNIHPQI